MANRNGEQNARVRVGRLLARFLTGPILGLVRNESPLTAATRRALVPGFAGIHIPTIGVLEREGGNAPAGAHHNTVYEALPPLARHKRPAAAASVANFLEGRGTA